MVPLVRDGSSTATAGTDFNPIPQNVTIKAGDTSAKFTVTTKQDDKDEGDSNLDPTNHETIVIRFGTLPNTVTSAGASNTTTTLTIVDDDVPGITISNTNLGIVEGDTTEGASFTVKLNSEPTANVDLTFDPPDNINLSGTTLTAFGGGSDNSTTDVHVKQLEHSAVSQGHRGGWCQQRIDFGSSGRHWRLQRCARFVR